MAAVAPSEHKRGGTDTIVVATAPSAISGSWQRLSPDALRTVFAFSADVRTLFCVYNVCRSWKTSVDHATVWQALCRNQQWPWLGKEQGKEWFIRKFRALAKYERHTLNTPSIATGHIGIVGVTSLYTPEQRIFYNWSTGREERVDNNVLITAGAAPHYGFKVWNTSSRKNVRGFTPMDDNKHPCKIACLSIDQDYIFFATAGTPTIPGPLYAYDLRASTAPRSLEIKHTSAVTCVRMRQTNVLGIPRVLGISGAYDQSARLWDLITGLQLCEFKESKEDIWSVDLHPSGKVAATGADDGAIRVYSTLGNGELLCTLSTAELPSEAHSKTVMALAFDSHEPSQLFSGGYDNVIKLWNYTNKQCIKQFVGHSKIVFCLLVLPDVIVSASRDESVRVWDRHNGRTVRHIPAAHRGDIKCIAPVGDGDFATGGYDGNVVLYEFRAPAPAAIVAPSTPSVEVAAGRSDCIVM